MPTVLQDLRYATRQLRKTPGFTILVVLTIALGIGANTALFSLLNGFLRPLPVKSPEQIVVLAAQTKGDETGLQFRFSYPALADFRKQANRFSDIFGFNTLIGGFTVNGKTTEFLYNAVTGNYFSALGLKPAAGRLFAPGEGENPGAASNIILSYSFWQKRFGGDAAVIGRQVRINGASATIIGVAPKGFHGLYAGADMAGFMPANVMNAIDGLYSDRTRHPFTTLGRMKPGVSLTEAQSAMDVLMRRLEAQYPATDKGIGVRVVPEPLARPVPLRFLASALPVITRFLLALAALVLLLACMNVANLLLVRATVRQREMAIRMALGSGRNRLIRQMLTESMLLAALGGGAGLVLAQWAAAAFAQTIDLATSVPTSLDFSFDWRVFAYAFAASLVTGIAIGVWPAIRASQTLAGAVLHDGARSNSGGPGRQRVRSLLVICQVAGSLVLLIVAGLFVRTLQRAQTMDLGFNPGPILNARMDPHQIGYTEPRTRDFYRELKRRVETLPGAQSASFAFSVPLGYINDGEHVFIDGRPLPPGEQPPVAGLNSIDGPYFETMGIPLVRGRNFRQSDGETSPKVAIVNETMARRFWPGKDPIGKRFSMGRATDPLWEVVGVARDSKYLVVFESPLPFFYTPLAQYFFSMRVLQIRASVPPASLSARVQKEIQALDAEMPVSDLQTMNQALSGAMGFMMFRLGAYQSGAMGLLGLTLAVIGIYGVVSYGASQRTREIGIRMALGAEPRNVLRLILGQGVRMVAAGVVAGLLCSVALTRVASNFMPLTNMTDPLTFAAVTLLLAAIALLACYIPAHRAMRVEPNEALRHE